MQFVVAFDGTPVAKTALGRAETLSAAVNGEVTALTVIPADNAQYARDRGWLDEEEPYSRKSVLDTLRDSVASVAPTATFSYRPVDRYAPRGKIGRVLRTAAEEENVDVLTIGTENAGRVFTALSTVTRSVSVGSYDLYVVREPDAAFR
jgi:nucleotide-binding universal stress UspA family protein